MQSVGKNKNNESIFIECYTKNYEKACCFGYAISPLAATLSPKGLYDLNKKALLDKSIKEEILESGVARVGAYVCPESKG